MTRNSALLRGQRRPFTRAHVAAVVGLVGSLILVGCADSQPAPSASEEGLSAGRAYALENCAECHNVTRRAAGRRTKTGAPDFYAIANEKTTSVIGLNAFLMTPHPTMPNLIIAPEDRRNIIAYILSLRRAKKPDPADI
ncbi:MAG: cytochrome c [Micropepsaceae bacterium]